MAEPELTTQTLPEGQNIQREIQDSGMAILTFDRPKSSANIFDQQTLDELNNHLDFLESNPELKGMIIRSAKPKIFIAGADLNGFAQPEPRPYQKAGMNLVPCQTFAVTGQS